jgi:hypothetical protein
MKPLPPRPRQLHAQQWRLSLKYFPSSLARSRQAQLFELGDCVCAFLVARPGGFVLPALQLHADPTLLQVNSIFGIE